MDDKKDRNYYDNTEIKTNNSQNLDDFAKNTPKMGNAIRGSGQNIINDANSPLEEFAQDAPNINNQITNTGLDLLNNEEFAKDNNIGTQLKNTTQNLAHNTKETLEEFASDTSDIRDNLEVKGKNIFNRTKDKLEEFASDTAHQIKKATKNIADKTKETINKITKRK